MSWPDFTKLQECIDNKHDSCPEWLKDSQGEKIVGCTCECHSKEENEEENS